MKDVRQIGLHALAALLVVPQCLASCPASADETKAQCAEANTGAQDLRRDGRLAEARERLVACASATCPSLVRDDCTRRLDELDRAQPTIAFEVKDASGADVSAVAVTLDGKPWTNALVGKPLAADPGKHIFEFTVAGQPVVSRTIVLTEGEKGRRERIVLDRAAGPTSASAPAPTLAPPASAPPTSVPMPPASEPLTPRPDSGPPTSPSGGLGTQRIVGLAAGGAGVVGLGVGTIFGLMTLSAWSSAKSACGGNPGRCSDVTSGQSHRDTAENDATVSTVGFIAGGGLVAAGAALFFTAGPSEVKATGLVVSPAVGPGQAGMTLRGVF